MGFSIYSFVTSIPALLFPAGWTKFDIVSFLFWSIFSFSFVIAGAAVFIMNFVLFLVWAWRSFRIVFFRNQNVATKAFLADNAEEVRKATSTGLFGFFYGFFENSPIRFLLLGKTDVRSPLSGIFPKGALILRTPAANWPVSRNFRPGSDRFKIYAGEAGGCFVVAYCYVGANAIGIFRKEDKEAVMAKLRETQGEPDPLDSLI